MLQIIVPAPIVTGPIGFISDIHGNLNALNAVLEELGRHDVKHIFAAGDLILGGKDAPIDVWTVLQRFDVQCIRGLSDSALCSIRAGDLKPSDSKETISANLFAQTQSRLGEVLIERIRRLPTRRRIPIIDGREILIVHGSPVDEMHEISHDLSDDEMLSLIGDDPADIIVCGATHVPFQRALDELHVVNVGSVGAAPEGPFAHFTVISPELESTSILQDFVEFTA